MAGFVGPDDAVESSNFVGPDSPNATVQGTPSLPPPDEDPTGAKNLAFERGPNYPNHMMTDPGISDALALQGVAGLGEAVAGNALAATGGVLDAISPNIVPAIGDTADDMLLKSMGTRAGQIKQMGGLEAARDASQVARASGAGDVLSTERGRLANLKDFTTKQGQQIGALRNKTGEASPDILDRVEQELMSKYNPAAEDLTSNEAPQVRKTLNYVKNVAGNVPGGVGPTQPLTNAGIAKGLTAANKYAAGEAMKQPVNAITDTANALSAANNAEIAAKLGPEGAAKYAEALKNEHGACHLKPVIDTGMAREAVARGGGKGILQSAVQKAADMGGYRAASKGLDALHNALANPVSLQDFPKPLAQSLSSYLMQKRDDQATQ